MSDDEQPDDHLSQLARANGKPPQVDNSHEQHVSVPVDNRGNGPASGVLLNFAVVGLVLGSLGFLMGAFALFNSSKVAEFAFVAGEAKSKAETATARANVSEIYAKQVYTELNRLGYPVKTPAEDHAPQPSDNVAKVASK